MNLFSIAIPLLLITHAVLAKCFYELGKRYEKRNKEVANRESYLTGFEVGYKDGELAEQNRNQRRIYDSGRYHDPHYNAKGNMTIKKLEINRP